MGDGIIRCGIIRGRIIRGLHVSYNRSDPVTDRICAGEKSRFTPAFTVKKMCAMVYTSAAHILHGKPGFDECRIKMCKIGDMMYTSMAHIFFSGFCGVSGRKDTFICSSFIDRYGTPYGVL